MTLDKLGSWVQVVSSIAVVVGLGLVISELQLARRTTYDGFASSNVSDWSSDLSAVYGEQAAAVLAKACYHPDTLNDADLVVLDAYLTNQLNRSFKVIWQAEFGWFSANEPGQSYGPLRVYLQRILGWPQGKAFLEQWDGFFRPQWPYFGEVLDEVLAEDTPSCRARLDRLRTPGAGNAGSVAPNHASPDTEQPPDPT